MLILKTPERSTEVEDWLEKITDMSVGHKLEVVPTLTYPILTHGREEFVGHESIDQYLEDLKGFVNDWTRCACEG